MLIDSDASGLAKAHQDLGGGDHSIYAITGDVSDAGTWAQARAGLDGVVPQRLVQCAGIAVSGILRAARRGDLYFFPPGEDRRLWRLKRLMPQRTLRFLRAKFRMMFRQLVRPPSER